MVEPIHVFVTYFPVVRVELGACLVHTRSIWFLVWYA